MRILVTNKYLIGIFTPCASVDVQTTQETYLFFNACSTTSLKLANGGNTEAAAQVGAGIAKLAIEKGISKVVFDRSGYVYHGRVKQVAEAAREAGLEF